MSKQKIREWLEENTGYFYDDNRITMDETIDIIHQYTQGQSGWVSVEDRLPEVGVRVLIFTTQTIEAVMYRNNRFNRFGMDIDYATHWMPLPLPPTQEA
jgi:hypothetical protein